MIPLSFLDDEYIDRPKLTEQKNPFEYIVPPPTSGVGTNMKLILTVVYLSILVSTEMKSGSIELEVAKVIMNFANARECTVKIKITIREANITSTLILPRQCHGSENVQELIILFNND